MDNPLTLRLHLQPGAYGKMKRKGSLGEENPSLSQRVHVGILSQGAGFRVQEMLLVYTSAPKAFP